jgi:hypothetical protein
VEKLIPLINPLLAFIRANFEKIIAAAATLLFCYAGFLVTTISLKKLKTEVFSYYPFDRFFPQSGEWSAGYFLIIVLLLGALVYLLTKGGFYLGPA